MITVFELLAGLFIVSELFALAACAVMAGTRRSSKQWFYATEMLKWAVLSGSTFLIAFTLVVIMEHQ